MVVLTRGLMVRHVSSHAPVLHLTARDGDHHPRPVCCLLKKNNAPVGCVTGAPKHIHTSRELAWKPRPQPESIPRSMKFSREGTKLYIVQSTEEASMTLSTNICTYKDTSASVQSPRPPAVKKDRQKPPCAWNSAEVTMRRVVQHTDAATGAPQHLGVVSRGKWLHVWSLPRPASGRRARSRQT